MRLRGEGSRPGSAPAHLECPACGLALPAQANFCTQCGAKLDGGRWGRGLGAPAWVVVVFWLGTAAALGVALVYGLLAIDPEAAGSGAVPAAARVGAASIAGLGGALCLLQMAASVGLTAGRPWARLPATAVCVLWALTCLGLPLALLALSAIWRPAGEEPAPVRPPP